MAGAVDERVPVAGRGNRIAGGGVDGRGRHARPHRRHGGLLRRAQHLPRGRRPLRGLPDHVGAGAVGVVAHSPGAADVDDHDVTVAKLPAREIVVRVRPIGARTDDDEVDRGVALLEDRRGQLGGDGLLGAPGAQHARHAGVDAVDGGAGVAELIDLRGVLAHEQLAQRVPGQHRGRPGEPQDRQQVVRGQRRADAEDVALVEAQRVGGQPVRILAVGPQHHVDVEIRHRRRRQVSALHGRQDQGRPGRVTIAGLCDGDDHARQALMRADPRPDEVLQIGAGAEDQAADAAVGGQAGGAGQALGVHVRWKE